MTSFATAWNLHRLGYNPVGYELRNAGAPNWIRFHSLPLSKRYPETAEERAILLERQARLAATIVGDGPCWIVQSHWPEATAIDEREAFRAARELGLDRAFSFLSLTSEGEWSVHAKLATWQASAADDLLLSIADDRAAPTIWMSAANGGVFAPYDGGVDLFPASAEEAARLKISYSDWLSPHSEGL